MKMANERERLLDEVLGLWARNEHGGRDEKVPAPEFLMSREVLQRLARNAAYEKFIVLRLLGCGEFALGMGVEVGAITTESLEDQNLGADARL